MFFILLMNPYYTITEESFIFVCGGGGVNGFQIVKVFGEVWINTIYGTVLTY